MKTEDIKRMAQAWLQVQEASKKKLDPVGKADADIDNDGDTDKSDKYLHNRRKAVSAAIKAKGKDKTVEVQTSEGKLPPALQAYMDKKKGKKSKDKEDDDEEDDMKEEADRSKLDVFMKNMAANGNKLYPATKKRPPTQYVMKTKKDVQKEEVEELDELSKKTLGSYVKKAAGDAVTKAYRAGDVRDKDSGKNYIKALGRQIGISTATNKLTKEEVEELDELSKKTLGSYVKKASRNLAGREYKRGAEKDASTANLQKSYKRDMGISKAIDKMTKEETDLGEAATASISGRPGVASPRGEGLSPNAKKELARTTPMPDFVNEPKIDKASYDAMRKSGKKAPARHGDALKGDKNIINKPLDITARASKKEDDGFKDA